MCNLRALRLLLSLTALFMFFVAADIFAQQASSSPAPAGVSSPTTSGPRIWLQANQPLPVQHVAVTLSQGQGIQVADPSALAGLGNAQPVSLASADLDADGFDDLVVGYRAAGGGFISIHRGNMDAFAPQSDASFQAIARGEFPSPFLLEAQTFSVPISPDFIAVGNFTGSGNKDLAVAAQGGSMLYVFPGDTKGNFGQPQTVNLGDGVSSLAAGDFGGSHMPVLMVGGGHSLTVYVPTSQGLTALAGYKLSAPVSNILFGEFGDPGQDVAFLSGGKVQILRSANMQIATVGLPVSARAFALGAFIFDRNGGSQIALVAPDGSVQIAVRNEFDPRGYSNQEFQAMRQARLNHQPLPSFYPGTSFPANGWRIVESFPGAASLGAGQTPVVFRTRISVHAADDVMVLNAFSGQMVLISHAGSAAGAATFVPGQVSLRPYTGTPIVALPLRTNADVRPGVIALHQGEVAPSLINPIPDPTFTVNTTNDGVFPGACAANTANECTVREAILESDGDTIMVPAGTYTLTIAKVADDCTGKFGALSIGGSPSGGDGKTVTMIGAAQNTAIIQAGTVAYNQGTANGVDMVMNVNEDLGTTNCPITSASASLSNLTLQNGHNRGTQGNDGDGGCMEFDTGTNGTANLTLTNVTLQNCDTTAGNGGGLAGFNISNPGNGLATISSSIVQGNSVVQTTGAATAGGLWASDPSRMSITSTQVLNNKANQVQGGVAGDGGGVTTTSNESSSRQTVIHSSTISGNQAAGEGGGIKTTTNLLVDTGTVISNNSAGSAAIAADEDGGGIFMNPSANGCPGACTDSVTLTKVTITGNSAANGGGIASGTTSAGGPLTMTFSRLAGNTASASGSNLYNSGTSAGPGATVATVTDNWWGTNAAASTISTVNGASTTFDPFIVLTHTASPQTIKINQSSTLTGDMSKDDQGSGTALSGNLNEIVGLPITFAVGTPVLGSIPQAQPETLGNPVPTATATYNAGGTGGVAAPTATVDQAVVPVDSNLISSATESGTTATITTVGAHGFTTSEFVTITGVTTGTTCGGYNGSFFPILSTPSATTFTYTAPSGLSTCSGGTASTGLVILEPPSITKSFNPTTVAENTPSTITFNVTNGNAVPIDASFTDSLPTNLVVSTPNGLVNHCGSNTVTATAGSGTISFSNSSLAAGTCMIQVNVQSAVDNTYSNSVTIDSTIAGNGNTATASLTVINPPHIAKSFNPTQIPLNATTSLTFTLTSSNTNLTLNGVAFTDTLPTGLTVPTGTATECGGTLTTTNPTGISLSGATLAPGASCQFSVTVTGAAAGAYTNTTGAVTSTNGGTGNTASANLTVVAPPSIAKVFNPNSIALNTTTSLQFTITNPNTANSLSGVAFTDTLPTGLTVASSSSTVCGGTLTTTAPTSISLSGATIAASGTCQFSVTVTGATAGSFTNVTGAVTSTEGGTGNTATANLTVVAPPSIAKAFNPTQIAQHATTSLTFTITNPAANTVAENGVAFTDTLPTGLTVASGTSTVCGGTLTTTNPTGISLTGATIAVGGTCQFSVTVTGATAGAYTNTTGAVSSTNGGTGNTASANLSVIAPPSIAKSFNPATIAQGTTTSLQFTITNPSPNTIPLTGVAFTDTLPTGLTVASGTSTVCGGTLTTTSPTAISLSGATVAASGTCQFSVTVTGATAGAYTNTTGAVTSNEGGTGNTASANLTVVAPPSIAKVFNPNSIALNSTTSLQFTITNPNTGNSLTGVAFTDTLPTGLTVGSSTATVCGGTLTTTAPTGISLSGATIAASGNCQFSVTVTGATAGSFTNVTGAVTSTEGGTGNTATANLTVVAPPSIAKAFNPTTIAVNATTSLTFTITNPAANTVAENGVAFTDTLPTGLTVASGTSTVCGGTLTTTAPTGISLSGATIATGGTCQFSVTVTGTASGQYTNTTGAVSSTNGGTGNTASANLTVASPPSITKSFGAANIPLNGTTTLSFAISNPNTIGLTGVAFTDNLPAGLVVASTPNLTNTCNGTATAGAGSPTVMLSGGTIAASGSCSVSVNVTGTTAGVKNNSVTVSSNEGGTGNTSTASVTVVAPPSIAKVFNPNSIALNSTTSLQFTITNPNTGNSLTGVAFTDTLPTGLTVGSSTATVCGGTLTTTAPTSISLSGATIAASGTCQFSVTVTGAAAGSFTNVTGAVTSNEGGTGNTATTNLTVVAPPSIAKSFNPTTIAVNATTSLTFTITNPAANAVAENGVAFTDTLPTGLTVASGTSTVCGGTLTTTAPTAISLSGATIATGGTCQFSVTVTGTASGQYTNVTGAVSSTNGGTGNTATANLTVASPPSITKSFGAASIPLNGTTTLSFSISNPNTIGLTGVAFTDNLPSGLVVASTPNLTNTCNGTATAGAGSPTVMLSGGTIAASGSCSVSVNVTGTTAGVKNNTVTVSSTTGGTGNTSSASITVIAPPTISKGFGAASIPVSGSTSLSFTIQNPNPSNGLTGVGFSDTLPSGVVISTPNGLTGSCGGGAITATQGTGLVRLSGASLSASASCTFSVNVTGTTAGSKVNTTGAVTSNEGGTGGTAMASINVDGPPSIAKAFSPSTIAPTGVSTLTFTISNPAANPDPAAGVAFSDTFPTNVVVANPSGAVNNCGGILNAGAGSGSVNLTGGSIAVASSCTVSVNVTSSVPGTYNNVSGAVSSTNGGTGNTASATLKVAHASLAITKTHHGMFDRGSTGNNYTITVSNSANAGPTIGTVKVKDTLPNVQHTLLPTALSGTGWTCTLATLTCTRSDALASGASYPPITLTVTVPIGIGGSTVTNSATVSGGGDPSSHTANDPTQIFPPD